VGWIAGPVAFSSQGGDVGGIGKRHPIADPNGASVRGRDFSGVWI
jgi:hypothetical protein